MTEQPQQEIDMQDQPDQSATQGKLVPVTESIKYRKRAQQAESKVLEVEQKLAEMQQQVELEKQELMEVKAQREKVLNQLIEADNSRKADLMLAKAGAVDIETAGMILEKRIDLSKEVKEDKLSLEIENLFSEKPFLKKPVESVKKQLPPMPSISSTPRQNSKSTSATLNELAKKAAATGNRKDVEQYLRLRRQLANQI